MQKIFKITYILSNLKFFHPLDHVSETQLQMGEKIPIK